jgi:lipoprotein Spr
MRPVASVSAGMSKADKRALIEKYENLTGLHIKMRRSLPLYLCIDKWMGVPYRYGAMSPSGTDCSGFTGNVYKEVYQKQLPRSSEDQYKACRKLRKHRLKEGDLVFFKTDKNKNISHVGIYLGHGKFVHASTRKGVRIDNLEDKYYAETFVKGGRLR